MVSTISLVLPRFPCFHVDSVSSVTSTVARGLLLVLKADRVRVHGWSPPPARGSPLPPSHVRQHLPSPSLSCHSFFPAFSQLLEKLQLSGPSTALTRFCRPPGSLLAVTCGRPASSDRNQTTTSSEKPSWVPRSAAFFSVNPMPLFAGLPLVLKT